MEITFLILYKNERTEATIDEFDERNYYLGPLPYDCIVWLLDGEQVVKAYKTLSSGNVFAKIF